MSSAPICPRCGRLRSPQRDAMTRLLTDQQCPECEAYESPGTLRIDDVAPTDGDLTHSAHSLAQTPSNHGIPETRVDLTDELVGQDFAGYHIDRFLGRGGMAWVFAATHGQLRRPCAVKVLCPDQQLRDPRSMEAFLDEARAAAAIVHPHVVTVHNIGHVGSRAFIELEYVPGKPLSSLFEQGRLPELEAVELLSDATAGLAAAHRQGMIHRDFKPSNVLVSEHQVAKLADFGLAKRIGDHVGGLAGTPAFMAPELFRGDFPSTRSDIYAVGISLIELVTGRPLFRSKSWTEVAAMHAQVDWHETLKQLPELGSTLADLALQCVSRDPKERFADGDELLSALNRCRRSLRPLGKLAEQAFQDLDLTWTDHGESLDVVVRLPNGRRQQLKVDRTECDRWGTSLIRIFSVCAPVTDSYLRAALELNSRLAHGAIAIQSVEGQPHFVMINTYPRATCDAEELRQSVRQVAAQADEIERALTGEDRR